MRAQQHSNNNNRQAAGACAEPLLHTPLHDGSVCPIARRPVQTVSASTPLKRPRPPTPSLKTAGRDVPATRRRALPGFYTLWLRAAPGVPDHRAAWLCLNTYCHHGARNRCSCGESVSPFSSAKALPFLCMPSPSIIQLGQVHILRGASISIGIHTSSLAHCFREMGCLLSGAVLPSL